MLDCPKRRICRFFTRDSATRKLFGFGILLLCSLAACTGAGKNAASPSPSAAQPAASVAPTPASATPTATAAPTSAYPSVSFTDLQSVAPDEESAIQDLGMLGVLAETSGTFRPDEPISRGTFVAWLIQTNNALFTDPQSQIRISATGSLN